MPFCNCNLIRRNTLFEAYPEWAHEFARKYLSKTLNSFILHGNVRDLVEIRYVSGDKTSRKKKSKEQRSDFRRFKSFLADEFFGARDLVLFYDRSSGIHFRDRKTMTDFNRSISSPSGDNSEKIPRDPVRVMSILEKYFRLRIQERKSIACVIDFSETIVPNSETGSSGTEDRTSLVYLLKWAQDPLFLAADFTVVLLTENLTDLNRSLVQSPFIANIKVGLPPQKTREYFIRDFADEKKLSGISEVSVPVLAQQTAGLGLVALRGILSHALENKTKLTFERLSAIKKEMIEAEAYGLLEFVETKSSLDDVAGHSLVKKHLRSASAALKTGHPDVLPMGYLVCGPVGTGKTYLVTCFAGEVGIPMVKLKNFRSQWQGVTEGNLEKILSLLDAMAPVAVMIDEADAYLGDRNASGDSGVSSRVFAQIAQFMSNTKNRGRIVWFLMTARPDLMPVDLKRQGRAEEHLALFYPETQEERKELFEAMKKKTGLVMTQNEVPEVILNGEKKLSGADMEAALTRARFRAATEGKKRVSIEVLNAALEDFLPPTYPEEIELQTLLAVKECTSREMLPERFSEMDRDELSYRIDELKELVR